MNATGGTTNYTYLWPVSAASQTTATATNLGVGSYIVTVTDTNGCTSTASASITQPTDVTALASAINQVNCFGAATGAATVTAGGGISPYTYLWSNGSTDQSSTNLTAGTYTVTVFDANGCTETSMVTITQPSTALSSSITSSTNPSCEGNTMGTATVTAAGGTSPYSYLWSNGQTTATATGMTAGTYLVTVTDMNGCTSVSTILLSDPTGITATITSSTNNECFGDAEGTATVNATGGTSPYIYLWSTSAGDQTTATATDLPAGQHSVTVTDANSCSAVAIVNITEPTLLIAQIIQTSNITCNAVSYTHLTLPTNREV